MSTLVRLVDELGWVWYACPGWRGLMLRNPRGVVFLVRHGVRPSSRKGIELYRFTARRHAPDD